MTKKLRLKPLAFLLILAASGLAGCGRKDVPDYPPDAIDRPGTLQQRRDPPRYY